jgi:hypothetical protein
LCDLLFSIAFYFKQLLLKNYFLKLVPFGFTPFIRGWIKDPSLFSSWLCGSELKSDITRDTSLISKLPM